jgi:hypothetical protein
MELSSLWNYYRWKVESAVHVAPAVTDTNDVVIESALGRVQREVIGGISRERVGPPLATPKMEPLLDPALDPKSWTEPPLAKERDDQLHLWSMARLLSGSSPRTGQVTTGRQCADSKPDGLHRSDSACSFSSMETNYGGPMLSPTESAESTELPGSGDPAVVTKERTVIDIDCQPLSRPMVALGLHPDSIPGKLFEDLDIEPKSKDMASCSAKLESADMSKDDADRAGTSFETLCRYNCYLERGREQVVC